MIMKNQHPFQRFTSLLSSALFALLLGAVFSLGSAHAQDTIPQGVGTNASVTDGSSVNSAIDFSGDRDWFRITLLAGRTYSFLMQGRSAGGTLTDTYLRLYNAAGVQVAQNDDFAASLSSFLTYAPTADAVFYIEAAGFSSSVGTYTLSVSSAVSPPTPQTGWWWSATEGGQGFGIEILNKRLFIGGFLYNADGTPLWFVSNGALDGNGNYAGNLTQYTGGQTLTGAFVTPTLTTPSIGLIDLTFTSATTATMRWRLAGEVRVTTKQLSRFPIAGGPVVEPAAGMPERGWYVSPGEDGRGWMLEVQGNQLFMAGFMYGSNGKPIWYLSTGPMTSAGAYSGNWATYGNGQTYTSVWAQTTVQTNANSGSVILNFTSPTAGSMTLPNGRVIQLIRFGNF